jgi:hypothetical protein
LQEWSDSAKFKILKEIVHMLVQQNSESTLSAEENVDKLTKEVETLRRENMELQTSSKLEQLLGRKKSFKTADECTQTDAEPVEADEETRGEAPSIDDSNMGPTGMEEGVRVREFDPRHVADLRAISSAVIDLVNYAKDLCTLENELSVSNREADGHAVGGNGECKSSFV